MKFIATGGFGEVYSASDGLLKQKNKRFAIKLIKKYRPLDQRVNTKVLSKRLQVSYALNYMYGIFSVVFFLG